MRRLRDTLIGRGIRRVEPVHKAVHATWCRVVSKFDTRRAASTVPSQLTPPTTGSSSSGSGSSGPPPVQSSAPPAPPPASLYSIFTASGGSNLGISYAQAQAIAASLGPGTYQIVPYGSANPYGGASINNPYFAYASVPLYNGTAGFAGWYWGGSGNILQPVYYGSVVGVTPSPPISGAIVGGAIVKPILPPNSLPIISVSSFSSIGLSIFNATVGVNLSALIGQTVTITSVQASSLASQSSAAQSFYGLSAGTYNVVA